MGLLAVTVIVGAVALGYALFDHTGGSSSARSGAGRSAAGRSGAGNSRPVDPATVNRDAADWVAAQLSPATVISCDPVMCQALESRRIPADQLLVLKPGMTSPLGSAVVVATPVLQKQIGARLSSRYAPGLLASFGSGSQQIQVRTIATNGAAEYTSQVKADLAARKMSGAELPELSDRGLRRGQEAARRGRGGLTFDDCHYRLGGVPSDRHRGIRRVRTRHGHGAFPVR